MTYMLRNLSIALLAASAALAANPAKVAAPLFFIANHGQAPPQVRFIARGSGLTAYFSHGEALFRRGNASVRMQFVGGRRSVKVEGVERLPGQANFLTGAESQWRQGVPLYGGNGGT